MVSFGSILLEKSMVPKAKIYKNYLYEISSNSSYPITLLSKHANFMKWIERYSFLHD